MNESNPRIPEDIADEVLQVASELYAQSQDSYSVSDLQAAAQEVNIPPELIEQAIQQVEEKRRLEKERQFQAEKNKQKLTIVAAAVGTIAIFWGILSYNSLSSASQQVDAAWAQVDNQLQRRADLIPRVLSVAKLQAQQEKDIVKLLQDARQSYLQATTPNEKVKASQAIDIAIGQFNQYAANSSLGSSQVYSNLQYEIAGTENRIATERKRYNEAVQVYNQKITAFPNSLIAGLSGFKTKEFFKATNTENPQIN